MEKTVLMILGLLAFLPASIHAQETDNPYIPEIHGSIRAKYEYEPTIDKGRFEIITVR